MNFSQMVDIVRSESKSSTDRWLFIIGDAADLTVDSLCDLGESTFDEDAHFEEIPPAGLTERGLRSTIDVHTVQDCIVWADRLAGKHSASAVCEVVRYYLRFDAFPATLGAEDPPPFDEINARLDREFYDSLGDERPGTECRRDDCVRGTVQFSVLCRPHHFESVRNKPSPFND